MASITSNTVLVFVTLAIVTTFSPSTAQYYGHLAHPFSTMMRTPMSHYGGGYGGGSSPFSGFRDSHTMAAGSNHGYQIGGGHGYQVGGYGYGHGGHNYESSPPHFGHGGPDKEGPVGYGHHAPPHYAHKKPVIIQPHIHREHVHVHNIYKHNIHHHNVHKQHIHQPVYHKTVKDVHSNSESHKNKYQVKEYNKHTHPMTQESHKWLKPIYEGEEWGKQSAGVEAH